LQRDVEINSHLVAIRLAGVLEQIRQVSEVMLIEVMLIKELAV